MDTFAAKSPPPPLPSLRFEYLKTRHRPFEAGRTYRLAPTELTVFDKFDTQPAPGIPHLKVLSEAPC